MTQFSSISVRIKTDASSLSIMIDVHYYYAILIQVEKLPVQFVLHQNHTHTQIVQLNALCLRTINCLTTIKTTIK